MADSDHTGEFGITGRAITRIEGQSYDHTGQLARAIAADAASSGAFPIRLSPLSETSLERVVRATRQLIVTEGFSAVTLDRLCNDAELSADERARLVTMFPDGPAVVAELLEQMEVSVINDISEIAATTESIVDGLREVGHRLVDRVQQDPELWQHHLSLELNTPVAIPAKVYAAMAAKQRQRVTIISALIAEGQLRGEVRQGDPELLAISIGASFTGMLAFLLHRQLLGSMGIYPHDLVESTLSVLVAGLRPGEP